MPLLDAFAAAAYIFDKDGTLIDTESVWFEAYGQFLAKYGATHTVEIHRTMMGASGADCVRILQAAHPELPQGEEAIAALLAEREACFHRARAEAGVNLLPGVEAFIHDCLRRGIPIAIATSASRMDTEQELHALGWPKLFAAVVTADDVVHPKPAPDIYLEAARRLGVDPARCVAFEDGLRGIQSAAAAGMKVVFVRDARFGAEVPKEAAVTVGSFEELM